MDSSSYLIESINEVKVFMFFVEFLLYFPCSSFYSGCKVLMWLLSSLKNSGTLNATILFLFYLDISVLTPIYSNSGTLNATILFLFYLDISVLTPIYSNLRSGSFAVLIRFKSPFELKSFSVSLFMAWSPFWNKLDEELIKLFDSLNIF